MSHRLLTRLLRRRTAVALALTLVAALALVAVVRPADLGLHHSPGSPDADSAHLSAARLITQPAGPATFRIATFNVLGANHTACGTKTTTCQYPARPSGPARMDKQAALLDSLGVKLAGFQEIQNSQLNEFMKVEKGKWDIFPKTAYGSASEPNQIAWNLSAFSLVSTSSFTVPYFHGDLQKRAVVLLKYKPSGQLVYVMNTHNASNTWGNAQKWRDQAVQTEAKLITQLQAAHPDIPVLFTGDMNDRANFVCPMLRGAPVHVPNPGVAVTSTACTLPSGSPIDWILGTPTVAFTGFTQNTVPTSTKISDHPLYYADATIAPAPVVAAGIQHVVVLDVEGLPSYVVSGEAATIPAITALRTAGASTLNARTEPATSSPIPNAISLLTGVSAGAHKVTTPALAARTTVAAVAGKYVPSVFDRVHDFGASTSLITDDPSLAIAARSWGKAAGAADKIGPDNGTNKLSVALAPATDMQAIADLQVALAAGKGSALSVVQVSGLRAAGTTYGFTSPQYRAVLAQLDAMVALLRTTIATTGALAGNTVLLLVADSGGNGKGATSVGSATDPRQYTVPVIAWGRGVPAGADLYAMNPALKDPGTGPSSTSTTAPPIRTAMLANLVTGLLGLPAIAGTSFDATQNFNLLVGP